MPRFFVVMLKRNSHSQAKNTSSVTTKGMLLSNGYNTSSSANVLRSVKNLDEDILYYNYNYFQQLSYLFDGRKGVINNSTVNTIINYNSIKFKANVIG